jgi:hypothetical protein
MSELTGTDSPLRQVFDFDLYEATASRSRAEAMAMLRNAAASASEVYRDQPFELAQSRAVIAYFMAELGAPEGALVLLNEIKRSPVLPSDLCWAAVRYAIGMALLDARDPRGKELLRDVLDQRSAPVAIRAVSTLALLSADPAATASVEAYQRAIVPFRELDPAIVTALSFSAWKSALKDDVREAAKRDVLDSVKRSHDLRASLILPMFVTVADAQPGPAPDRRTDFEKLLALPDGPVSDERIHDLVVFAEFCSFSDKDLSLEVAKAAEKMAERKFPNQAVHLMTRDVVAKKLRERQDTVGFAAYSDANPDRKYTASIRFGVKDFSRPGEPPYFFVRVKPD